MQTEATPAQADVSELDLVKQCQAGDTQAFDQLVSRYRTRVFGMIYNMVRNEQDAWDLAQDSFCQRRGSRLAVSAVSRLSTRGFTES